MTTFALDGSDGLVEYLAVRLAQRGHRVVDVRSTDVDALVRVVDPTREAFATHVDAITTAARALPRESTVISIVTRHSTRTAAKYKQAAKDACVKLGIDGIRSVGIVTDEVRDPTTSGMNPIEHALHEQLFSGTVDPECVVLACEVAVALDGVRLIASDVTPWLSVGAGAVRDALSTVVPARGGRRTRRALATMLVENGFAHRADAMTTAVAVVGDPRLGDACPNDFEDGRNLDDPAEWFSDWVAAINDALDRSRIDERRVWIVDDSVDTIVALTSAREWAICASSCATRA